MSHSFKTPSLQFSGHETFPLRQLWLRKAFDNIAKSSPQAHRSVFSDEESIARFGVGRNMVTSIRHWSLACGFMHECDGGYAPTDLATKILSKEGLDPYLEHPATVWLIQREFPRLCRGGSRTLRIPGVCFLSKCLCYGSEDSSSRLLLLFLLLLRTVAKRPL